MKTCLPIIVKYSPIKKLALIPFEKSPDTIYRGFELQFIEGEPYGKEKRKDIRIQGRGSCHRSI